jgi:hypothetical protein
MDILELTHHIFSKQPKDPNSIQLDFSEFIGNVESNDDNNYEQYPSSPSEELFKQLLMIFTEGMKMLYGDKNGQVNLENITQNNFDKVNQYFNSFGIKVIYKIINDDTDDYINIEKKELKNHQLRLRRNNLIYVISFDYYVHSTCR